jgi:hypothetical protein
VQKLRPEYATDGIGLNRTNRRSECRRNPLCPEMNIEEETHDENTFQEASMLHHDQDSKELLINLSKGLVQALSVGGFHAPNEGSSADGVGDRLDQLRDLSKAWDRLAKKKKIVDDEGLWNRLLDACRGRELETLRQQGYGAKAAAKLIRDEHAWWDSDSRQFLSGSTPPKSCSSVEVVVVQREAGFRIHEEILPHLWQHPEFSRELSKNQASSPRDGFYKTLESVDVMAGDYGFDYWEYFPSLDELDDPDRRAVDCIFTALELRYLLESEDPGGGSFFEDAAPSKSENPAWLSKAKKGERLWLLLNAAIKLGQSLNHWSTFRDASIERAIRRMLTTGKKTTEAGDAVERIIRTAMNDGLSKVTPEKLLTWLRGTRTWGEPLIVNHPMWGSELANLDWEGFENLVKSALRRLMTKGEAEDSHG